MEECANCHDTGWISARDEDGLAIATRCPCIDQNALSRRQEGRERNAEIPPKYADCTFDNFDLSGEPFSEPSGLRTVQFLLKSYADRFPFPSDPHGILLYGGNGVGKTHLAVAVLRRLLAKGHDGRYINYQALLRLIKSAYDKPFGAARTEEYDALEEVEVLLLDDLGSNRVTDWVEDTITELVAQRHDRERPVIVTTNYSPWRPPPNTTDLYYLGSRVGERVASRLREMCKIVEVPGVEDQRGKRPHRFK